MKIDFSFLHLISTYTKSIRNNCLNQKDIDKLFISLMVYSACFQDVSHFTVLKVKVMKTCSPSIER